MTEQNPQVTPAQPPAAAPAPVQPPAQPPAQQPPAQAAPAAPPATATDPNPAWLPDRLSRAQQEAKQQLLAELGIQDPAKAKEILTAAQKAEDDAKSAAEKLGETSTRLTQAEQELARHRSATKEYAARLMLPLSEEQKNTVTNAIKTAGGNPEDPATQVAMVMALAGSFAPKPPETAAASNGNPAPATPPTGTAPPSGAAPPETQTVPTNHQDQYAALQKTNPFAAATYALNHVTEVFPEKT